MKNLGLILFFYFLLFSNSFAQLLTNDVGLSLRTTGAKLDLNRFEEIKGSPYLFDKWNLGSVTLENSDSQAVKNVKFNCFQNQFEYEFDGKAFTPTNKYKEFTIINIAENMQLKTHTFRNGFVDKDEYKTYFEVLYDGKTKLLKKHSVRIDEYAEPLSTRRLKRFSKISQLYIYQSTNNKLIKIKNDKKSILSSLEKDADVVEKYIAENKFRFKNEEEIIKICTFYDEL
jgi:hypothetical protein